nr:LORF11 [Gallid alphaherpesvirus 2]WOL21081.1 LORF11 [Gallid alphaherpesvirus 2]WOL21173.1 protein LORF5 [Gallid alphaherpesvirus 2]WOL21270.1 LORF11 [Gallid alphaherpesvirus 2]WOL21461.1 LORF11 [Gallid alphaherpesvirus 2]
MHCVPTPERESRIAAIPTRALTEAQKYVESSLHVDMDTC